MLASLSEPKLSFSSRSDASEEMRPNASPKPQIDKLAAAVEIKTGKRRVIEYMLDPLIRYRSEAMRER
ncbi:MAG: hypothetical protein J5I90_06540 [Caldilineales bacterium]|nr:hypothetical protein [Caldilineales bacterium]